MIPVFLTKIKTRDGIALDGIFVKPRRKSKTALIWVHGLTSSFHSSQTLIKELSSRCQKAGVGYFKFDTRGHDVVARGQGKHKLLGTIYERFEDCTYDIRAMTSFAKRLGYKNIILAGHSTGANKAVYYLSRTKDQSVKGLVLIAGLNDIAAEIKRVGKKKFNATVRLAKKLYRKDPLALFTTQGFIFTARRYLSLHAPGMAEDVFPYYNPKVRWKALAHTKTPLAVIIGAKDEYLNLSPKNFIKIFRKNAASTKSFSGITIKGAGHSFRGKEKELAGEIVSWIKKIE